jgi:serine acetyltransferase/GT2 family glycosyltransferase
VSADGSPRASVVVATYNRGASIERLVRQLAAQTVARDLEVVIVDDGSREDPTPRLRALAVPFSLAIERQKNAGAAAARHRAVTLARAPVILFLDDDMQVDPHLVAAHLELHDRDPNAVVLGRIKPDPEMKLELFERFHADVLERFARDVISGKVTFRGPNVYTGNLSMKREAYLRAGGFDATLGHSEDAELGVRLEKNGATFYLSDDAASIHSSDRDSLAGFRKRAKAYGTFDSRIGKKHPDVPHASPWRYFRELSTRARPLLALSLAAPRVGESLATAAVSISNALDRAGLERAALKGMTLVFGLEYARGMRAEAGAIGNAITDWLDYARRAGPASRTEKTLVAATEMRDAVREDHATLRHYSEKYGGREGDEGDLPRDAVVRIGFQIMVAVRLMHFFRDAGATPLAMVTSRLIRHLYGSDIHWDAKIEPGVQIVHGMGLAISPKARIGKDAIIFHNVTLGESANGAPSVGRNVHIGPGATLLGPITVGEGSKIMASCVVREDVPPGSLVSAPDADVRPRVTPRVAGTLHTPPSKKDSAPS